MTQPATSQPIAPPHQSGAEKPPTRSMARLAALAAANRLDYTRLFDSLKAGRRRVVSTQRQLELLCPHTPLEDPEWPTPVEQVNRNRLLARLPHRQRVICALTAAEMTMQVWEERQPESVSRLDPVYALTSLRKWIAGDLTDAELKLRVQWDADATGMYLDARRMAVVRSAAAAVRCAVGRDASDVERAITHACDACGYRTWRELFAFLADWWRHCRCRMPFCDAITAEIA